MGLCIVKDSTLLYILLMWNKIKIQIMGKIKIDRDKVRTVFDKGEFVCLFH